MNKAYTSVKKKMYEPQMRENVILKKLDWLVSLYMMIRMQPFSRK